ncbi:MAG TPA: hypothetical protein VE988_22870 [Gemmataceae bacterium]|nr:hypothetical protein [Gemmataceae bacterium]
MPIPREFAAAYSSEKDFVDRFIVPLFRRLGFALIYERQGANEFGSDVIFGDIDAFGHTNYFSVQLKYVDTIGKTEIRKLAEQCIEAFQNPFQHPRKGTQERVARFYAVNGGEFTQQARIAFFNAVPNELRGCVFCLDGNDLLALDKSAGLRGLQQLLPRLQGILHEIRFNRQLMNGGASSVGMTTSLAALIAGGTVVPGHRLWTDASSEFMRCPVLTDRIDLNQIVDYWLSMRFCNENIGNIIDLPFRPREGMLHHATAALSHLTKAESIMPLIETSISAVLADLGPIAAR